MKINLPYFAQKAIKMLSDAGYEAYVVGGCVRDSIMGKTPFDWDITTSASPEEIKSVFSGYKVIETGIIHGTVTVIVENSPLEITTYRIDGCYSDNRHPDKVQFTKSLKEDLSRRDFTINALAYNDDEGVIDFFGGIEDIKSKIIKTVGNPYKRFSEDALRILRALRFSSQLSFSIEEETQESIRECSLFLQKISVERINSEFTKLLCGENVREVLTGYSDVFIKMIPELEPMIDFNQKTPYHIYDVYEHTVRAVENIDSNEELRLTMLFHDIGKPFCFKEDENGRGHFKGHNIESVRLAKEILSRLRYNKATINKIELLIEHHDVNIKNDKKQIKHFLNKLSPESFFDLLKVKKADNLAQSPEFNRSDMINGIYLTAKEILSEKECFCLDMLNINGNDLMDKGLKKGKEIGEALDLLLNAVIDEKCENKKEKLISFYFEIRQNM